MARTTLIAAASVGLLAGVAAWVSGATAARSPAPAPSAAVADAGRAAAPVRFNRDVRPLLSDNCFHCHGPDAGHRKAKLRLDTPEGLFAARGDDPPAVAKGDPAKSPLYQRIVTNDPDEQMPPAETHKKLSPAQKDLLKRWIEQGAEWEPHWAFARIDRPAPPPVNHAQWVRNPIDAFVLSRLEREGLEPAPEADRRTLARRLSLDLVGLPPAPADVDAFVADKSPDAYERYVDRLLASPAWGEHRGRYWLDAARYADTHGIHNDNYREMWPYRDWVIEAFNRNLPFDRFVVEQLAGDLLPGRTLEQQVATGFQRCNITTSEGGSISDEVLAQYAKDRVETYGAVFLGLTTGCASCHDHKFDPLTQRDFYSLAAFFRNTTQNAMDGNAPDTPPVVVVPPAADRPRWEALAAQRTELAAARDRRRAESAKAFDAWVKAKEHAKLTSPLDPKDELVSAAFDGCEGPAAVRAAGADAAVPLPKGVAWGEGPAKGEHAVKFTDKAALDLSCAGGEAAAGEFDPGRPFSVGAWVLVPPDEGGFAVASRLDPKAKGQSAGWALSVETRVPTFRLFGADGKKIEVRGNSSSRPASGKWAHLFVTYDGSRHPAGVTLYVNGRAEFPDFAADSKPLAGGAARSAAVLRLGTDGKRDLKNGALAEFRLYGRELLAEEVAVLQKWPAVRKAIARADGKLTGPERGDLQQLYLARFDAEYARSASALADVEQAQREIRKRSPVTHVMAEKPGEAKAKILFRGQYDQPRDEVVAATPAALHQWPAGFPRNRLGLAWWTVDPRNHLTARVTANRFWQELFGTGVVRTSEDFGIMGENPSNPELLEWLAAELRQPADGGPAWDVKRFFKLMVTSATYRQSAAATPEKLRADPQNRLLSRGPRFRMDAEVLRDSALAASGLLNRTVGGPSVKPYQPPGVWEAVAMFGSNTRFYKQDAGEKLYRRSMYTFLKRSAPPPAMDVFNAPTREVCTVRRERTNTPLQALATMNDPQWVEAARVLAERAMAAGGAFDARLDAVTLAVLARRMDADERAICRAAWDDFRRTYAADPEAAKKLIATGEAKRDESLPPADHAAWTMLASQVMNTDEALNK
ncbi:MAG TPA: DUF1553 domain-containing protein [Humisphaera sp.]